MEFLREKGMLMGERQPVSLWEETEILYTYIYCLDIWNSIRKSLLSL